METTASMPTNNRLWQYQMTDNVETKSERERANEKNERRVKIKRMQINEPKWICMRKMCAFNAMATTIVQLSHCYGDEEHPFPFQIATSVKRSSNNATRWNSTTQSSQSHNHQKRKLHLLEFFFSLNFRKTKETEFHFIEDSHEWHKLRADATDNRIICLRLLTSPVSRDFISSSQINYCGR